MSAPDRAALAERVKKILRLAKDKAATPEEAATAAAMAQKLIDKFRLDAELLKDEEPQKEPERPTEAVIHYYGGAGRTSWISDLVSSMCRANGCYSYTGWVNGTAVHRAAGAPEDLETVAYMVAYLIAEVEKLAREGLARRKRKPGYVGIRGVDDSGRTWGNNFRLGCVETIVRRINEMKKAEREAARNPQKAREAAYAEAIKAGDGEAVLELDRAGPVPVESFDLVRVDAALARLDTRREIASKFAHEANPDLKPTRGHSYRYSSEGYAAGKIAGEKVSLSKQNRRLA